MIFVSSLYTISRTRFCLILACTFLCLTLLFLHTLGDRQHMNFALNSAKSVGNSTWENMYGSKFTITKDFPLKPGKGGHPSASVIDLPFAISSHSNSSNGISACKTTSTEVFPQGLAFLKYYITWNEKSFVLLLMFLSSLIS